MYVGDQMICHTGFYGSFYHPETCRHKIFMFCPFKKQSAVKTSRSCLKMKKRYTFNEINRHVLIDKKKKSELQ